MRNAVEACDEYTHIMKKNMIEKHSHIEDEDASIQAETLPENQKAK